ncbi:MAG: PEGA domain-containing protein [Candidatus Amesbacteria bacterium]|nr:PEGA domain-containing protein [Candidatus Amesbacteria bacterium]
MRTRILLFLLSLILVPTVTVLVILFARGYRFSLKQQTFQATGLLSATSLPTGASIYVNGELKSATDTTLNLVPGIYQIKIKKEGFNVWEKQLKIEPEVVTRASPLLFPSVPSLKAVTFSGASLPSVSDDGSKVAYLSENQLFTLDLSESPLGLLNRESRLITPIKNIYKLIWSPDNKYILGLSTPSAFLVDINKSETQPVFDLKKLTNEWNMSKDIKANRSIELLPVVLKNILATSAANLVWSPRENKLMYTATASATLAENLIPKLPGSNTQPESRDLKAGCVYVYDLEEDKNFLISAQCSDKSAQWFSDSNHLIKIDKNKVIVFEYDGQNPTIVYTGPMENNFAVPYPSSKQLLILSNLTGNPATQPNLYAVSLR